MKKSKKKPPAHLQKLVLNLTAPIKFNNMEVELKMLNVLVGQNDSGKSFLLKVAYALSAISCMQQSDAAPPPAEGAQFIFDNTFVDHNLDGTIKGVYTRGSVLVELKEGKVTKVEIEDLVNPVPMLFLSTDMRTFDQMNLYLCHRNGASAHKDPVILMRALLKGYRIYDVTYMESLIQRCPITLPDVIKKTLAAGFDFKEKISAIDVDLEGCQFHAILEDGTLKNLATYGKGHQSILNMVIGIGA
jgi:hypothetical protein